MQPIQIFPEYSIILTYDIKPGVYERYFRWVSNDLFPIMQERKIYIQHLWHVIGGTETLPERQIEFITEDLDTIQHLVDSTEWSDMEQRLQDFVDNYSFRVVKYKGSFKV